VALKDGRTWMEHLTPKECWALLASTPVGRIGLLHDSAPEIYPVNFAVDGESVLFRTDPGTKLRAMDRSPSVCFQVDGVDPADRTGWSVLVKGRAMELTHPSDLLTASELDLPYWVAGEKAHWVRIVAHEITGRRIGPAGKAEQ